MLLLPGHQHDLWHQYHADNLLTSQDLLCSSLLLILMHSALLVWKNIFMVNTPLLLWFSAYLCLSGWAVGITSCIHHCLLVILKETFSQSWYFFLQHVSIFRGLLLLLLRICCNTFHWCGTILPAPPSLSLVIFNRFTQVFPLTAGGKQKKCQLWAYLFFQGGLPEALSWEGCRSFLEVLEDHMTYS